MMTNWKLCAALVCFAVCPAFAADPGKKVVVNTNTNVPKADPAIVKNLYKPDLEIVKARFAPGTSKKVQALVKNRGLTSFNYCFLQVKVYGTTSNLLETRTAVVPGIPGGQEMWITIDCTKTQYSDNWLQFEIDSTKKVVELRENNNTYAWDLFIY